MKAAGRAGRAIRAAFLAWLEVWRFDRVAVRLAIGALLFGVCQTYASLYLSKQVLDGVFSPGRADYVASLACLTMLQLASLGLHVWSSARGARLSAAFANRCDGDLIERTARLDLQAKEHPRYGGELSLRRYAAGRRHELYLQVNQLLARGLAAILGFRYLADTHAGIGLLAVAAGLAKGGLQWRIANRRAELNRELQRRSIAPLYLFDLLTGSPAQKELTMYGTAGYFKRKWLARKQDVDALAMRLEKLQLRSHAAGELLTALLYAAVVAWAASVVRGDSLTPGDFVSMTMALTVTVSNLASINQTVAKLLEHDAWSADDGDGEDGASRPPGEGPVPFSLRREIRIEGLTFAYPNRPAPALRNICLTIRKGETIALLGENGSGKSTLIKLIVGLYKTDRDCIFYDGVPIRRIEESSLRAGVGAVFQDFVRYQTDVRENTAVGRIGDIGRDDKLLGALDMLGLTAELPQGLDTKLGQLDEDAVNLSGGQWQRLALARVLLREDAELLVFDEPTAALDPVSEMRLLREFLDRCRDRTALLISHRVGVARRADRIVVLKDGAIAECGTHDQLLNNRSHYYRMWTEQQAWYA